MTHSEGQLDPESPRCPKPDIKAVADCLPGPDSRLRGRNVLFWWVLKSREHPNRNAEAKDKETAHVA